MSEPSKPIFDAAFWAAEDRAQAADDSWRGTSLTIGEQLFDDAQERHDNPDWFDAVDESNSDEDAR